MTTLRIAATGLFVLLCLVAARPHDAAAQATFVQLTKPMGLAAPVRPAKGGVGVYIVKLKEPGAATYKGGAAGYAATKPGIGQSMSAHSAAVQTYVGRLEQTHDRLLAEIGAAGAKVYSYSYVLNGFAAKLTAEQVSRLAQRPEVERVWLDSDHSVDTNNSAIFLGLENQDGGLRADLKLRGENIVVGVIDSGVAPNHPSLADKIELIPRMCRGHWAEASWLGVWLCAPYRHNAPTQLLYDPPIGFTGACQTGPGFEPTDCNNKLVGARFYLDGFLSRNELDPRESRSPRDADGHGTHVATTIAGNPVDASLFGTRVARVAGIAPRARVAVYKACWIRPGETRATCATSDLARAVDDAVADGVDIINYSLGSLETDLSAPDDLALLNAFDAGVLTVVAAGNDGPDLDTIGSPSSAPWVMTVAASTQSGTLFDEAITITAPEDLAGAISSREASFTPQLTSEDPLEEALVEADDGQETRSNGSAGSVLDACEPLENGDDVDGHLVLIERGGCEFELKIMHAEEAGAVGVVVYNTTGDPIVMNGDAGSVQIPAVMIGAADAEALLDALAGDDEVRVELARGTFLAVSESGNQMADFSSRGPALSDANFLKPDVTAPGVDILAGTTPAPANGLQGETFGYFSGTSQAAPEVTGVAILLKEAHPDWSPGTLKSALMTSAYQSVTKIVDSEDVATTPFDRGSGHIDANKANDPGLVYASDYRDYAAYLCGLLDPPLSPPDCTALAAAGFSNVSTDVNLPSIAVARLITGDTVKRKVTNVGPPATYHAAVTPPPDFDVVVDPQSLVLNTGQTGEFSLRFVDNGSPLDLWNFGELKWTDDTHTVVSPIAIQPVALRVPLELHLTGRSGSTTVPIAFGYSGEYTARSHGLRAPFRDGVTGQVPTGFVDDDTGNSFRFPGGSGISLQGINVPEDQLYLRVALFDEFTDGEDDLDLYLFFCPNGTPDNCTQLAQSGGFTSDEQIDVMTPEAGLYVAVVHGFETDQVTGGPGANYSLFTWSFGVTDDVGNLDVAAPTAVVEGDRINLDVTWSALDANTRYLGAISHDTPFGLYELTIVDINAP